MTHARTLPWYVGAAGLVAGLLVAFPSLAFEKVHISNVTVGGSTPTTINAYVNARYQYSPLDSRRYYKWQVPVAKSTLRTGALAALGRGVMHPGFHAAVLATGYIISESGIFKDTSPSIPPEFEQYDVIEEGVYYRIYNNRSDSYEFAPTLWQIGVIASNILCESPQVSDCSVSDFDTPRRYLYIDYTTTEFGSPSDRRTQRSYSVFSGDPYQYVDPNAGLTPVSESDLENIDPHIPPQLLEELWADLKPDVTTRPFTITPQTYPEPWYNQLDVSSLPLSQLSTTGTPAPEVVTHVAKQMENLDAQMEGREKPHPSVTVAPGASADEEMLDRWDEPVPDFTEVNPEWQVETIDELPSYNIGIGSGQCPPPTVITLPFPLNSNLVINWQPFCDLAAMIRGAVIAVAMILSLYIVLRRG